MKFNLLARKLITIVLEDANREDKDMINSVANEGLRGLQVASRELQKSSQDIANLSLPKTANTNPQNPQDVTLPPVNDTNKAENVGNIAEPVIELKRQEVLFSSAAKVVSVANENIGTLLDIKA